MAAFLPVCGSAETIYGSTLFRNLVSFDSSAPGTFLTNVPITGLTGQVQFEQLAGIDFRPSTGVLYGIGNAPGSLCRLYTLNTLNTLNTVTGIATRAGFTDLTLSGNWWGMDFNPVTDDIRFVSDNNASVRVNSVTVTLSGTDAAINPSGAVVGLAYTNPGPGATLFGMDSSSDKLVRIGAM